MDQPRVRAPQLPDDPALWLNTGDQALQLQKGIVYLLDFWTYGCINCLHILPDLRYFEEKYRNQPFAVVGVHSGKFDNEKNADAVRNAVERHNIDHAVVRDDALRVWSAYNVRAWPTLVLIDAEGYVVKTARGEGNRDALDGAIGALLRSGEAHGTVGPSGHRAGGERAAPFLRSLAFPGKVLADPARARLFIADSGHHRLVIAHDVEPFAGVSGYTYIGSQTPGFANGPLETARFRGPQGMALSPDGNILYVADAGNHAIRRIDLQARVVETIAGTGAQARGPLGAGAAREVDLNSPWDLLLLGDDALYVAMAGAHQIGLMNLASGHIAPYAGNGREARTDGPLHEAAFAQPSGLASDGERLFVADAETSCIRAVGLGPPARVETLAGGDLFDWGDRDGAGDAARLQHPLGVAYHKGAVFVADTYNHKIRRLDPATRTITGFAGRGDTRDLYEPGGLSIAGGLLYIADTNHHRVRVADGRTGALADLPLGDWCAPMGALA